MKQQQGFSLIELLIVVGIIGALTAIAVPAFEKYREKSEVTAAIASVKSMRTAIDISISEKSADFPADDAHSNNSVIQVLLNRWDAIWCRRYFKSLLRRFAHGLILVMELRGNVNITTRQTPCLNLYVKKSTFAITKS